MGIKSRGNWYMGKNMTEEKWEKIFGKKEITQKQKMNYKNLSIEDEVSKLHKEYIDIINKQINDVTNYYKN